MPGGGYEAFGLPPLSKPWWQSVGGSAAAPAEAAGSTPPLQSAVLKLEAKVVVDDGTGEMAVQLCDCYDASVVEQLAAVLADGVLETATGAPRVAHNRRVRGTAARLLRLSTARLAFWAYQIGRAHV